MFRIINIGDYFLTKLGEKNFKPTLFLYFLAYARFRTNKGVWKIFIHYIT